eukprot:2573819-Pleurochrysis_carterae.AAC.3
MTRRLFLRINTCLPVIGCGAVAEFVRGAGGVPLPHTKRGAATCNVVLTRRRDAASGTLDGAESAESSAGAHRLAPAKLIC